MTIEFECKNCFRPYKVKDSLAGRQVTCKECGNALLIPGDVEIEDYYEPGEEEEFSSLISTAVGDAHQSPELPPRKSEKPTLTKRKSKKRKTEAAATAKYLFGMMFYVVGGLSVGIGILGMFGMARFSAPAALGNLFWVTVSFFIVRNSIESEDMGHSIAPASIMLAYVIQLVIATFVQGQPMLLLEALIAGIGVALLVGYPGLISLALCFGYYILNIIGIDDSLEIGDIRREVSTTLSICTMFVIFGSGFICIGTRLRR